MFVLQPRVEEQSQGKMESSRALDIQPFPIQTMCFVSGICGASQDTILPSILKILIFRDPLAVQKTLWRSGKIIPLVSEILLSLGVFTS